MRIVVTDANIFFDLIGIGALGLFFQLEHEVHTTVLVLDECSTEDMAEIQGFIASGRLHVRSFTVAELHEVGDTGLRKGLRPPDRSVLYLAKELPGIVLTGDGDIRKECGDMTLECHGILWCITELLQSGHYDKVRCLEVLDVLQRINKWLPKAELEKMRREVGGA